MPLDHLRYTVMGMPVQAFFFNDAPDPPDPYAVADAQYGLAAKTAAEQKRLGMDTQVTDTGQIQYIADPNSPSGYRQVSTLSPEEQALLGQSQDLRGNYGSLAGEQLGRASDTMSQPFTFEAGRAKVLSDMNREFLDPQWASREDSMKTDLFNRGIREGSDQWNRAISDFGGQRGKAYDQMFLDSYDKANNYALQERNLPLDDMNRLGIGIKGPMPTGADAIDPAGLAKAGNMQTPDLAKMIYDSYNAELKQYGSDKGGIGSLVGTGLKGIGGWATGGPIGAMAAISDKRLKTEIKKIGDDPRGWGVYQFKYIHDAIKGKAPIQLGFMAQEVEKIRPDAVYTHPESGMKMVNYEALSA